MKNWQQSFPTRPLRVKCCDFSYLKTGLIYFVLFVIIFFGFCFFWKPHFITDFRIMKKPDFVQNFTIENSRCHVRLFVIHTCKTDATMEIADRQYHKHFSVTFLGFGKAGYRAYIVYRQGEPQLQTLNLAIEHIWQRSIVFGIVVVISLLFLQKSLKDFLLQYRQWSIVGGSYQMLPVVIALKKIGLGLYSYRLHLQNGKIRKRLIRVKRNDPLFFIDKARGYVLGAIPKGCDFAIVFDRKLTHVDFTEIEKENLREAITHLGGLSTKTMQPVF